MSSSSSQKGNIDILDAPHVPHEKTPRNAIIVRYIEGWACKHNIPIGGKSGSQTQHVSFGHVLELGISLGVLEFVYISSYE